MGEIGTRSLTFLWSWLPWILISIFAFFALFAFWVMWMVFISRPYRIICKDRVLYYLKQLPVQDCDFFDNPRARIAFKLKQLLQNKPGVFVFILMSIPLLGWILSEIAWRLMAWLISGSFRIKCEVPTSIPSPN